MYNLFLRFFKGRSTMVLLFLNGGYEMFCTEMSVVAKASAQDVWALWSDVGSWSKWDPDVEVCQLKQSSFQKGATAILKPRGGPKINIEIVECIARQKFVSHSFLPLTTIV